MPDAADERFLTEAEVREMTSLGPTTRWKLRRDGRFPPLIELSPGKKMNTLGQIRRWQAERVAEAEGRVIDANAEPSGRGRPRKNAGGAK